ncbi:MAG: HD domain-containing protein [Nitrospiraceae bacterium]|nr:HD domain-containing protein [Nitrospiraceae bacterium]MSR24349.1 HD domain-containing protein [Nitrospiraceae bacterium]
MQALEQLAPPPSLGLSTSSSTASVSGAILGSTLRALDAALQARDICTHTHCQRVIYYSLTLGRIMGLSEDELVTLERGVFLHDIGKIHMPDSVLLKPGLLSDTERTVMQQHPSIGYEMLRHNPLLTDAAEIVLTHHERYNGSGYPLGLKGDDIPLGARICAITDTFDAITSIRPYRTPMSVEDACNYIQSERGCQYDPEIVDMFTALPSSQWQEVRRAASTSTALNSLFHAA